MKLRGQSPSFLLESVEAGSASRAIPLSVSTPRAQYIIRGNEVEVVESESARVVTLGENADPTYFLQEEMSASSLRRQSGMPRFVGGLVGYLGYESVSLL